MFARLFRKPSSNSSAPDTGWWREAAAVASAPEAGRIDALARSAAATGSSPDEAERQDEMIEGLRALLSLTAAPALPIVDTQHRVIGADVCHFVTPASLADRPEAPGKLFLTSARVLFAAGKVSSWPWHRVGRADRIERDVILHVTGQELVQVRCNSYGDALVACHLAARLSGRRPPAAP